MFFIADEPGTFAQNAAASLGGATIVVVPVQRPESARPGLRAIHAYDIPESMIVVESLLPKTGWPFRRGVPLMLK